MKGRGLIYTGYIDMFNLRTISDKDMSARIYLASLLALTLFFSTNAFSYAGDPAPVVQAAKPVFANADNVFNWKEVPVNEKAFIVRAKFDAGGYQLYDSVGEIIVVPFAANNLYVMKFGVSDSDRMYFTNDGSCPALFLPKDGFLENATVDGARWYPFGDEICPPTPVYLGIAPSWRLYVDIGWFPKMRRHGGYWSSSPFAIGVALSPTVGFYIEFNDRSYTAWGEYRAYYKRYPAPFHGTYFHRGLYALANASYSTRRRFGGTIRPLVAKRELGSHANRANSVRNASGGFHDTQNSNRKHKFLYVSVHGGKQINTVSLQ
jgi:hypothetical protein